MKIKHQKEHDNIVSWISENPDKLIESVGIKDTYEKISYERAYHVYDKSKYVGTFDLKLNLDKDENLIYDDYDENGNPQFKYVKVFVTVNVKMESATEQLRELKKTIKQQMNNTSQFKKRYYFVVVSENDQYKSFFTDENMLFYKFRE